MNLSLGSYLCNMSWKMHEKCKISFQQMIDAPKRSVAVGSLSKHFSSIKHIGCHIFLHIMLLQFTMDYLFFRYLITTMKSVHVDRSTCYGVWPGECDPAHSHIALAQADVKWASILTEVPLKSLSVLEQHLSLAGLQSVFGKFYYKPHLALLVHSDLQTVPHPKSFLSLW